MNKDLSMKPFTEEEMKSGLSPLFKGKGLRLAILFGSAASGKVHRNSDIDIAFLFERHVDILELTNTVIRLLHVDNVDVIDLRKATERLLQELIEAAIDINTRIIVHTHNTIVDDYYESFTKMGDINVIPVELAKELAP